MHLTSAAHIIADSFRAEVARGDSPGLAADLPTSEVVAVSLGLCALAYAPPGIAQLPPTLPSPAVIGAVAVLGVACTAAAFLLFFRLIAEVAPCGLR